MSLPQVTSLLAYNARFNRDISRRHRKAHAAYYEKLRAIQTWNDDHRPSWLTVPRTATLIGQR